MDDSSCNPQKQCLKCKEWFPATPKFFYRNKSSKDQLSWRCKTCYYIKDERPLDGFKRCPGCNQVLPKTLEYFHSKKNASSGFHDQCKSCRKEKPWKPSNEQSRENIRKRQRLYRQNHLETVRAYQRRYEASDRGKANRKKHYDDIRARQRRYYRSDRGQAIFRAARLQRSIRKHNVPGKLTSEQIQQKLKAQRYRCYYGACGHAKFEKRDGKYIFHIDHTIPLSRPHAGPRHDIDYTVLACPSCNLKKYNKLPHEWAEGGRLF